MVEGIATAVDGVITTIEGLESLPVRTHFYDDENNEWYVSPPNPYRHPSDNRIFFGAVTGENGKYRADRVPLPARVIPAYTKDESTVEPLTTIEGIATAKAGLYVSASGEMWIRTNRPEWVRSLNGEIISDHYPYAQEPEVREDGTHDYTNVTLVPLTEYGLMPCKG